MGVSTQSTWGLLRRYFAELHMIFILLIFLLPCGSFSQDANYDSCKKPLVTWNGYQAKKVVLNVSSFEDCANLCKSEEDDIYCEYFTWNFDSHPYAKNSCFLFSAEGGEAGEKEECKTCVSGARSCFCESPFACKDTGENLLLVKTMTRTAHSCENLCNLNPGCFNYTWFTTDHELSNLCFLYKDCSEVDSTCSGCCSGVKTFDPCAEYNELSSPIRNIHTNTLDYTHTKDKKFGDGFIGNAERYDWYNILPDWKEGGWYRFTGEAGTKLAEEFPGFNKCGSKEPAYLFVNENNKLPSKGTAKSMKVCQPQVYRSKKCEYKEDIKVMNCGDYFTYQLTALGSGNTYCGV